MIDSDSSIETEKVSVLQLARLFSQAEQSATPTSSGPVKRQQVLELARKFHAEEEIVTTPTIVRNGSSVKKPVKHHPLTVIQSPYFRPITLSNENASSDHSSINDQSLITIESLLNDMDIPQPSDTINGNIGENSDVPEFASDSIVMDLFMKRIILFMKPVRNQVKLRITKRQNLI